MSRRLALPEGLEWNVLLAAAAAWAAVAASRGVVLHRPVVWSVLALVGSVVAAVGWRRMSVLLVASLVAAASLSGIGSGLRESSTSVGIPEGTVIDGNYRVVSDPVPGRWGGHRVVVRAAHGLTLLADIEGFDPRAGEQWALSGTVAGPPGRWRSTPYAGLVDVRAAALVSEGGPVAAAANVARDRVARVFADLGSAGGLVSGFLIGETSQVHSGDLAAMRASGLSHFVAVSGSNVALFLGLWWLVTFFAGFSTRSRAMAGLIGLVIFVWITRWEPSVVRASVMAGLVLVSRAVGVPLTGWSALGSAVAGIVMVSGELVDSVGFQLSVAATCGVMAGHRWFSLRVVGPLLSATAGAQVAVAPLLLIHFGSVPIVSPLANLAAVPLVTGATGLGAAAAVLNWSVAASASTGLADAVLSIAHLAAGFPHVGTPALLAAGALAAGWRWAPVRVLGSGLVAVGVSWTLVAPPPVSSGIVVLDVGQGDSILLIGDAGEVVLVDGGPDQEVLLDKLRTYRIRHVDLVVNTHPHHDHVAGLVAVVESMPVGLVWRSGHADEEDDELARAAAASGVAVVVPHVGSPVQIGSIRLEVLGPVRRYASPNDQSIAMIARVNDVSIALVGDIETYAQADLGPVVADVLKVPHQGAATSDLDWIRRSAGSLAVISVGPNQFGHPSADVIEALEKEGSVVVRTDVRGDVIITSRQDALEG